MSRKREPVSAAGLTAFVGDVVMGSLRSMRT